MPNGGREGTSHTSDTAREAYPIAEISAIGEVQRELGDNLSRLMQVLAIVLKPEPVEHEDGSLKEEDQATVNAKLQNVAGRSILYTQLCGVRSTAEALNRSVLSIMERLDF